MTAHEFHHCEHRMDHDPKPTPIDPADIRPGRDIHAEQQAFDRGWHAALAQVVDSPIDKGDIREGDVLTRREVVQVARVLQDAIKGTDGQAWNKGTPEFVTWHLVSRPDPDAEAIEALAGILPQGSMSQAAPSLLAALREQGWDVVRRAES